MNVKAIKPRIFIAILMALLGTFFAAAPALASSVGTAQVASYGPTARVSTFLGGGQITYAVGNIQQQPCTSGRATWVHMTMNGTLQCYGYTGTFYFSGNSTYWFCAGNNYGTVKYWKGNTPYSLGFTNGTNTSLGGGDVYLLTINGSRGSNTC